MKGSADIFLKLVFSLLLLAQVFSAQKVHPVIIVGAGVSGLRASQVLAEKKVPHLILESRDKPWGRVEDTEFQGHRVDLGGSFINLSNGSSPLYQLAKKHHYPLLPFKYSTEFLYQGEGLLPKRENSFIDNLLYHVLKQKLLAKYPTGVDDADELFEYIKEDQKVIYEKLTVKQKRLLDSIFFCFLPQYGQLLYLDRPILSNFLPLPTMASFTRKILPKPTNLRLSERVIAIDHTLDLVNVTTTKGSYLAKAVIVSVPLGVLKKGIIKFTPELSKKRQIAIENIGFRCAEKLFVRVKEPFWRKESQWVTMVLKKGNSSFPFGYFLPFKHSNILVLFDLKQDTLTDEERLQRVQIYLRRMTSKDIVVKATMKTKWCLDQNFYGQESYSKLETTDQHYKDLRKSIQDKIWFSGEYIKFDQFQGFINGAYEVGQAVALQVAKKITH